MPGKTRKHGIVDHQVGHDSLNIHPIVTQMVDEINTMMTHLHLREVCERQSSSIEHTAQEIH